MCFSFSKSFIQIKNKHCKDARPFKPHSKHCVRYTNMLVHSFWWHKRSVFMISKVTSDYEFSEPYLSRVHPDVGCTASLLFHMSADQSAPGKKVFIIQRTVCRSWGVLLCRVASSCLLFQLMYPTIMLLIFSRQCWTCFVVQASFQISPNARQQQAPSDFILAACWASPWGYVFLG